MPKIKRLTKAERQHRKEERSRTYYERNREEVNRRARESMQRFRARTRKQEAVAKRQSRRKAREVAELRKLASRNTRGAAQWQRKHKDKSDEMEESISDESPSGSSDYDSPEEDSWVADLAADFNFKKIAPPPFHSTWKPYYFFANTTMPESSLQNDVKVPFRAESLPPSSPPSEYSDMYDSDCSIPVAPYSDEEQS